MRPNSFIMKMLLQSKSWQVRGKVTVPEAPAEPLIFGLDAISTMSTGLGQTASKEAVLAQDHE